MALNNLFTFVQIFTKNEKKNKIWNWEWQIEYKKIEIERERKTDREMAIQFETGASGQMVADASLSPSSVNKK